MVAACNCKDKPMEPTEMALVWEVALQLAVELAYCLSCHSFSFASYFSDFGYLMLPLG